MKGKRVKGDGKSDIGKDGKREREGESKSKSMQEKENKQQVREMTVAKIKEEIGTRREQSSVFQDVDSVVSVKYQNAVNYELFPALFPYLNSDLLND